MCERGREVTKKALSEIQCSETTPKPPPIRRTLAAASINGAASAVPHHAQKKNPSEHLHILSVMVPYE